MSPEHAEGNRRHINVLALIRKEERYVFLYDPQSREQLLRTLGEYAADPELSFSWYDAAVLSQRIAEIYDEHQHATRQQTYDALRRPNQHNQ
jgi:hypothetical protein